MGESASELFACRMSPIWCKIANINCFSDKSQKLCIMIIDCSKLIINWSVGFCFVVMRVWEVKEVHCPRCVSLKEGEGSAHRHGMNVCALGGKERGGLCPRWKWREIKGLDWIWWREGFPPRSLADWARTVTKAQCAKLTAPFNLIARGLTCL